MIQIDAWTETEKWSAMTSRNVARTPLNDGSNPTGAVGSYNQVAVTFVAMIRSPVSFSVVNRSRGKPLNAERVVFITARSAIPARTLVASRPATTTAVRVSE